MMRKTQRMQMIEEVERGVAELFSIDYYSTLEILTYWRTLGWAESKDYIGHSVLKVMVGRIKKDLVAAKAARYDAIAPHYEQLLLGLDLEDVITGLSQQ